MEVIKLTLGELASNTYLVKNNQKLLIIDPGFRADKIIEQISDDETVLAIILTHGHYDHIGAVNDVLAKYDVPVYASLNEKTLLADPNKSFYDGQIEKDITYFSKDFQVDDFKIIVHHTPGHTAGSVMFEIENHLFSGDTIFKGSIGRMDLPTGSTSDMQTSLAYIKNLTKDYHIYPGHGDNTTLSFEKTYNPYLK